MFLLLVCAGLLIAILYSPIGSEENYVSSNNDFYCPSVVIDAHELNAPNFKSKRSNRNSNISGGTIIPNLPTSSFASSGGILNNSMPNQVTIETITKRPNNYAVNISSESTVSSKGSYAVHLGSVYSNEVKGSSSRYSDGAGGSFSAISSRNTKKNIQSGLTALNDNNITVTMTDGITTLQGGGYTPGSGATDPGEDPIGNPIPVSDGFWVLLLMAVVYGSIKFFKKTTSLDYAK